MLSLHPRYLTDDQQRRQAVVLALDEWQKVLEDLEELDDIRAYDAAKADPQEAIPFEQAVREIREGRVS
ncbi:MAG TPA: hypothetical protein P5137_11830 [Candidatus Brocadiia bacterium]|nr:hypothetical protein [Candidatus Brocadiia bacterium]